MTSRRKEAWCIEVLIPISSKNYQWKTVRSKKNHGPFQFKNPDLALDAARHLFSEKWMIENRVRIVEVNDYGP